MCGKKDFSRRDSVFVMGLAETHILSWLFIGQQEMYYGSREPKCSFSGQARMLSSSKLLGTNKVDLEFKASLILLTVLWKAKGKNYYI